LFDNLDESAERGGRCTSLCPAAGNYDGSGPHVLLLVDAQLVNAGTIKSGRDERVGRSGNNCMALLRLRGEGAKAQQRQEDASQDNKQAD
jgi:hypothetical protein